MRRMDEGMPFLLQYEHVAWYADGAVRILDRRVYPAQVRFVTCTDYRQVAQAIADMVTQSAGPYTAVGMGMALAAHQARGLDRQGQEAFLTQAHQVLSHSRPTAANRYGRITAHCLETALAALDRGEDPVAAVTAETVASLDRRYATMQVVGDHLAALIPDGGAILTQCFGETIIGAVIRAARQLGRQFRVFCPETRPYLQGARLTASCFAQAGFDTTVITDNMAAWVLEREGIDLFTSAADTITRDGHIANKIGTLQLAILAQHFGVPYYVTGIPDGDKAGRADIVIEQRDPAQVLSFQGVRHTAEGVRGVYPAFDVTPPALIRGVVTDRGVFAPGELERYFETPPARFY